MAQFLFPGWLIISYFLLWKKEGIDIPGRENDFLVKILAGKALKVKILAGYCILTSTSSWLWGAEIIFPKKLIINQKTLSDCQNITGGDIQSLSNFFSLSTPEDNAAELQTVQCRQQESSRRFCETPNVHELKYGFYCQSMSKPCLFSSNLFFNSS